VLRRAVATALLLGLSGGCARFTKSGADHEVYGLLGKGRTCVPEVVGTLDVEAREADARAAREVRARRLTLAEALSLGTLSSRDYRLAREDVYLAALSLTLARNEFRPLFGAAGSGDVLFDEDGASADLGGLLTLSRAFETGGSLVLAVATDVLKNLTTDPLRIAQSILSADLVLPLARGSGVLVARENLRQAERDTIYALRSYARFQQEFTVDVARSYYRALELHQVWKNEESAFESLSRLVEEQAEKGRAGIIPEFQVDQARQDLLRADDRRQRARAVFEAELDRFKLQLGIPVDVVVELDPAELEALRAAPLPQTALAEPHLLATAWARRLDLRNARDQETDAQRKVLVAKDALRGDLDLRLGADLTSGEEHPYDLRRLRPEGRVGLDVELPLERTAERNAWRSAMIVGARATRARERFEDQVALEVREDARSLEQARRSTEIQEEGVRLAERRVESTALLLERGDATIRDRLEAEDARTQARNALANAQVERVLAHLSLLRDLGTLRVDAQGRQAPDDAPPEAAHNGSASCFTWPDPTEDCR